MIQTIPNMRAVPTADVDTAGASRSALRSSSRAFAVSIAPAQSIVAAPAGRSASRGAFPLWLQGLDDRGSPLPKVLITGPGTYYFSEGLAAFWLEAGAAVATGTDAQFDVTIGTTAGDWLEPSRSADLVSVGPIVVASWPGGTASLVTSSPFNGPAQYGDLLKPSWASKGRLSLRYAGAGNPPQVWLSVGPYREDGTLTLPTGGGNNTLPDAYVQGVNWAGGAVNLPYTRQIFLLGVTISSAGTESTYVAGSCCGPIAPRLGYLISLGAALPAGLAMSLVAEWEV